MALDPSFLSPSTRLDPRNSAVELYRHESSKARMSRFWAWLRRKQAHLLPLGMRAASREGAYVGMRTVEIGQILGSEERAEDFDDQFRPLARHNAQRWVSVAEAKLSGVALPPVQLVEVNGSYFVRDGHHRISVAKALGESFIDAEVVRWQMR